jgi:hypothetical protein
MQNFVREPFVSRVAAFALAGATCVCVGCGNSSHANSPGDSGATVDGHVSLPPPPDPCTPGGGCPSGVWFDVTPSQIDLVSGLDCGNYGTKTVVADPYKPQDLYTMFFCQGVWKSSDYGHTWTGPINTGMNGATAGDCAGGISISPRNTSSPPTLYEACIRGHGLGFWRSTNGGVDWTNYQVAPAGTFQQFYPPEVDPYDVNHLLMSVHTKDQMVESMDGGQTWADIRMDPGMIHGGGNTGEIKFIDTGNPSTTRNNWIWLSAGTGGHVGTWRTEDGGANWTMVDKNEHTLGATQIYQPDTGGVVFMAGVYSASGWGVLRSPDYGKTWTHLGANTQETLVLGTPKNVYALFGYGGGPGATQNPSFEHAPAPGTGMWTSEKVTPQFNQGPATGAVTNDGKHSILVVAAFNVGVWRYDEP